jgi:di/tricarboxylate transporter
MNFEIVLTFAILGFAILLFVSEIIRVDLVALGVLVALALTGLVQPEQALSGFSNPAVVTVWAMFILSAGLARTGIASMIGKQVLQIAGSGDGRLIAVLMTVTGLLSAFMNNIGVAAMFLPITMEISRRTRRPASQLLMPMAYGSLLGGLVLLIGTASNLLVRDALREAGFEPLGMFDFTIGGLIIMFASVSYMTFIGRHLLPARETPGPLGATNHTSERDIRTFYGLEERLAYLIVPPGSPLVGKTLSESRIGLALGLNVLNIERQNGQQVPLVANVELVDGDRLLILGRLDRIDEIAAHPILIVEENVPAISRLLTDDIGLAEFQVTAQSALLNKTLAGVQMRQNYGVNVLAIQHGELVRRTNLQNIPLEVGDWLLLQGHKSDLMLFEDQPGFKMLGINDAQRYQLQERLLLISIPEDSSLVGRTLEESRLGSAFGLAALSINQGDDTWKLPQPQTSLQAGDKLVIGGRPQDIEVLRV